MTAAPIYLRDFLARHRPVLWPAILCLIAVTLAADLSRVARPDMAFLLYAAGRVLDGARLYRDVVEINPPLIIWLNVPVVALARAARLPELALYSVTVAATLAALLVYATRVARRYALAEQPALQPWLVLLAAVALFPVSGIDFGQREQLVLALLLPYVLLIVSRLRPYPVPKPEATAIGLLAAVALALKPHFVLAWIGLEALSRWRDPAARWRLTPEAGSVVIGLTVYALIVRAAAPEYLEVAAVLGPAYARYLHAPFLELLVLSSGAGLTLFACLAMVALRHRTPDAPLTTALCVAMVGCFVAAAAQQKGLGYHFFPALALGFVLVGVLASGAPPAPSRPTERLYALVAGALVLSIALVTTVGAAVTAAGGGPAERRTRAEFFELVRLVREHAEGRPVAVLSYHIESAFPLVSYAGVPLASRFPHLWIFAASYWDALRAGGALRYHTVNEMSAAERWLNQSVREDLFAAQPALMLVLRPARDTASNGLRRLHYIQYFEQDAELAGFFEKYRLLASKGEYDVYERVNGSVLAAGAPPSREPGVLDIKNAGQGGQGVQLALADPTFAAGCLVFLAILGLSVLADRRGAGHRVLASAARGSPP